MSVTLKYKQRQSKDWTIEERFGIRQIIQHSGTIDYEQEEVVDEKNVSARIKELKSFSNREYHSFTTN
jgi:hypothetical protein